MSSAADLSISEQNALIVSRCAVCHDDDTRTGGMSLEHYDAAHAPSSLAVMLLSQLTNGMPFANYTAGTPESTALTDKKLKNGAINAAGSPVPPKATVDALVASLVAQSKGATAWTARQTVHVSHSSLTGSKLVTASQSREVPSTKSPGDSVFYQLTLTCNLATHQGEMQLAWSPLTETGHTFIATADGNESTHLLDGKESATGPSGRATRTSIVLSAPGVGQLRLPKKSLVIADVFPGETVTFAFDTLSPSMRAEMSACFPSQPQ
jgi:hypothetical protein